jgi:HAD superfamily hydrolase (TIGR01509 family)
LKKLIIFDFDGVIVDSEIIACKVEAECLTEIGFAIDLEENIRRFAGVSADSVKKIVEKELNKKLPENFHENQKKITFERYETELKPIKNVKQMLSNLINDKCIASSSSKEKINKSLNITGLGEYFDDSVIYNAEMVKNGKPAPDLFLLAAEKMGYEPKDCIVVEDSISGVKAGKSANMTVFGFIGGSHILDKDEYQKKLILEGADLIFDNMKDFIELINKQS